MLTESALIMVAFYPGETECTVHVGISTEASEASQVKTDAIRLIGKIFGLGWILLQTLALWALVWWHAAFKNLGEWGLAWITASVSNSKEVGNEEFQGIMRAPSGMDSISEKTANHAGIGVFQGQGAPCLYNAVSPFRSAVRIN